MKLRQSMIFESSSSFYSLLNFGFQWTCRLRKHIAQIHVHLIFFFEIATTVRLLFAWQRHKHENRKRIHCCLIAVRPDFRAQKHKKETKMKSKYRCVAGKIHSSISLRLIWCFLVDVFLLLYGRCLSSLTFNINCRQHVASSSVFLFLFFNSAFSPFSFGIFLQSERDKLSHLMRSNSSSSFVCAKRWILISSLSICAHTLTHCTKRCAWVPFIGTCFMQCSFISFGCFEHHKSTMMTICANGWGVNKQWKLLLLQA